MNDEKNNDGVYFDALMKMSDELKDEKKKIIDLLDDIAAKFHEVYKTEEKMRLMQHEVNDMLDDATMDWPSRFDRYYCD